MCNTYTIDDIEILINEIHEKYSDCDKEFFLDPTVANTIDIILKEISILTEKEIPKKHKLNNKPCSVEKFVSIYTYVKKTISDIYKTQTKPIYLNTNDSTLYYSFRNKIATQDFKSQGAWPSADLQINSNSVQALAILKPASVEEQQKLMFVPNSMAEYIKNMSDLTADVFDILNNEWINKSKSEESMITITAAEILKYRGIQPRGKRDSFHKSELEKIAKQIDLLDQTWLNVFQLPKKSSIQGSNELDYIVGESKAIVLSSRAHLLKSDNTIEPYSWRIRPGDCFSKYLFGPGRKRALLSQKAVAYDYYRQKYEKRLTRFLSWEWGISNRSIASGEYQIFKIKTLLDAISFKIEMSKPSSSKDKFEKILNTLENDKIISRWQYNRNNTEFTYGEKFWVQKWLDWDVCIQPPIGMLELEDANSNEAPILTQSSENNSDLTLIELGTLLKETRIRRKYSQLAVAVILDISRGTVSKIESGKLQISSSLRDSILSWINDNG